MVLLDQPAVWCHITDCSVLLLPKPEATAHRHDDQGKDQADRSARSIPPDLCNSLSFACPAVGRNDIFLERLQGLGLPTRIWSHHFDLYRSADLLGREGHDTSTHSGETAHNPLLCMLLRLSRHGIIHVSRCSNRLELGSLTWSKQAYLLSPLLLSSRQRNLGRRIWNTHHRLPSQQHDHLGSGGGSNYHFRLLCTFHVGRSAHLLCGMWDVLHLAS